jgi:hypothetical protein
MAIDPTTQQPPKAALGGNQMNPDGSLIGTGGFDPNLAQTNAAPTGPATEQYAQNQAAPGPALGGGQVGVNPNPNDPTMPGYQYGTGPTNQPIQGQIAGGVPDYSTVKIDANGMPVQSVGSGEQYMKQMQDAYMAQAKSRLDPQWEQQQAQLENQLQQQGLTRGSSAWNAEMDRLSRGKTDAYGQAINQSILTSGAEAERMQRMGIAGGEFANKQAQQDFVNKMASQDNYNAALKEKFESNMKSGMFANAAQAQEAAQKALDAQIRNAAMGSQEAGALGREQLGLEKEKVLNQQEQFAQSLGLDVEKFRTMSAQEQQKIINQAQQFQQTFAQNDAQFKTMSAMDQQKITNQAAQFAQSYELQTTAQKAQMDQFAQTLGMDGKQLDAQIGQWAEQNGISREQMAQQLAISTSQMTQQDKQFYATLAETKDSRAQQAAQFAQNYDLASSAQKAQIDQFAQTLGMTGKQLDAQINQWAAQNGLSREQMANALAIANVQASASMAAANASAGATVGAAQINAATQADRLRQETIAWAQQVARQSRQDPLLEAQLRVNILNSGGTVPPATTTAK